MSRKIEFRAFTEKDIEKLVDERVEKRMDFVCKEYDKLRRKVVDLDLAIQSKFRDRFIKE